MKERYEDISIRELVEIIDKVLYQEAMKGNLILTRISYV